jgi:hypothetical protein
VCLSFHCIACFIDVSFLGDLNLNGALLHPKMWVKEEKKITTKGELMFLLDPCYFSLFFPTTSPPHPFPSLFASLNKCIK